jgi:hypothetical protein
MAQNYNIDPYFDDFNPDKNFYRILFKPGYAVQARELTQSQTILQNQISNFAEAIYSQNTPVSGGKVTTNLNAKYIKLNSTFNNASVVAADFLNKKITDVTGTILASVTATDEATGNAILEGDPPTLVVTYLSGTQFSDGMTVYITDGETATPYATTIGNPGGTTSIGNSSTVSVSRGVFWVINGYNTIQNADGTTSQFRIGNFVTCLPQTAILDKYDNSPTLRAGLNIVEETVTYIDDSSLLDPAVGSTNYQAPGADRYKISLNLITKPITFGDDESFIELVRYDAGETVKQSDNTVYSAIDDYFAKRDYETNGDYIVNDFKLTPVPTANGNSNFYDMIISKGVAYVLGYRVENQSNYALTVPRARTTTTVTPGSNNTFINYGSYFATDYANGNFNISSFPQVDLHCVVSQSVNNATEASYASTKIGTAFLRGLQFVYNTSDSNTKSYVYNAFVNDIETFSLSSNAAAGSTSTEIKFYDLSSFKFSTSANAYYGGTIRIDSGTSVGDIRTIVSYNASTKTATVDSPFTVTPDVTSQFTLIFGTQMANSIVKTANTGGTGTVASPLRKFVANTNINIASGKVNGVPAGYTILNSSAAPELLFSLGNEYVANNTINETTFYSTQLFRNQSFSAVSNSFTINTTSPMYFQGTTGQTYFGDSFKNLFTVIDETTGQILAFNDGANTATVNTSTSATFSSAVYSRNGNPVTVVASVYASIPGVGDSTGNVLKIKNKITGNVNFAGAGVLTPIVNSAGGANTNTFLDVNSGQTYVTANIANLTTPISLYVSDLITVQKIIDTGSAAVEIAAGDSLSNFTDITTSFSFNDGQKDNFYDHATIQLKPGAIPPLGNMLVVYDYYSHSGGDGFFTVSSYIDEDYRKIPTYIAKNGTVYSLRDCVDFRPTRKNGVLDYTWDYKSLPSTTSGGIFFPQNRSNFICGYNYYLGRRDKLVLTKDSEFLMIIGTPAKNAQYPIEPDGSLLLAQITLDPYTSYVPGEGPNYVAAESTYGVTSTSEPSNLSVTKILHKRWAKSDITDLQTQVNNLEYYTALSILESNANALQIPDVNGLNRFKNGILVDDFSSFATAETYSEDFNANINIRKKTLGPVSFVTNYSLQNPQVIGSYGTASQPVNTFTINSLNGSLTNLFTLPYSVENIAVQQLGSGTISINPFNVVNYEGICTLNPPIDNWVNSHEVPSILITDPRYQFTQTTGGVNLTNAGDYQSIPGTTQQYNQELAAATNDSYASQTVGINRATNTSSAAAAPLSAQNGYVTNEGLRAYIRPQEVIVRAKGLLVNSPLSAWFDGLNVDKYITQPDIIELTGVRGNFKEDDIIGFYDNTYTFSFYPVGRVVSAYKYPTNNQTRLYISEYIQLPTQVPTNNLINAYFAANGKYLYSTAYGNVTFTNANSILYLTTSGTVTGPGITFTTLGNTSSIKTIYKSPKLWGTEAAGTLLNNYGVWGDNNFGTTYNVGNGFRVPITSNGVYTLKVVSTATGTVGFGNNDSILSPASSPTNVLTAVKNISGNASFLANTTIRWSVTASATSNASFAAVVYDANNNVIWNTLSPNDLKFDGSTANIAGPDGGIYYAGLNTVSLSRDSSDITDFYVGGEITIKSTYTYPYNYQATYLPPPPQKVIRSYRTGDGDPWQPIAYVYGDDTVKIAEQQTIQDAERKQTAILMETYTFTANIVDYNGVTKVATLDRPVDIAMGTSAIYGNLNSKYNIRGTVANVAEAKRLGNTIPGLSSNENGEFVGVFSIPGSQFFSGERVFRVDNRNRATNNPASATTFAEATFYAGGIFNLNTLSPSVDSSATTFTRLDKQSYNIISIESPMDPLAQTFILDKKNYPNGAYLNSIKLFFAPFQNLKKPTTPVTVSIVETLNGYPTGRILDYSRTIVDAADIKTSNRPHYLAENTWTEFVFDAPVYVESGVLYAVLIQANSADYLLYYGGQNEPAIISTAKALPTDPDPLTPSKIGATPYVGSLFESQNSITWTADQTKALMFVLSACKFDITKKPTISFVIPKNLPNRKLGSQSLTYAMNANVIQNLYGTFETSLTSVHAFNLTTTDFTPTQTNIDYTYATTLGSTLAKTSPVAISPGRFASPLSEDVYLSDGLGTRVLVPTSNNSFEMIATLSSTDPYVSPIISDDGTTFYSIIYSINNMGYSTPQIQVIDGGTGYNNTSTVVITSGLRNSNTVNDFGQPDLPVFGYTTNAISGAIQSVYTTYRGSGYIVTPSIAISNPLTRGGNSNAIISISGETSPNGGNGRAKYYTKKVVLSPSNESGDLRVYYSAYKPLGSEVYIYYRILNTSDTDILQNQNWQLMTQLDSKDVYSTSRTNIIEYVCAPGYFDSLQPNNSISYTSTTGTTYDTFNQFQIKVVMSALDPTNPPFLTDIRAIALPAGTGI